ncbi:transglutaminase-like cysteine peptidase [Kiloniella sp. b19]|uniref:transglutaminase-like cysteine peptidase n=1 Tax=Kiloniella sp. GXU_MW_B19 TaxID=3141326 RepID=UPI0031E3A8FD
MIERRAFFTRYLFGGGLSLVCAGEAVASQSPLQSRKRRGWPSDRDSFMVRGFRVPPPESYRKFMDEREDLKPRGAGVQRVGFEGDVKAGLVALNASINSGMKYRKDKNGDVWGLSAQEGDCEDYAINKLDSLLSDGSFRRNSFSIALCQTENGEDHAVLVFHAREADLVLDNRFDHIRAWNRLPYFWLAIESHKQGDFFETIVN